MGKDHHDEYDQGTLAKLNLLKLYLIQTLQIFLEAKWATSINVYDFFCGPGQDRAGNPGSPRIIIEIVLEQQQKITAKNKTIRLIFNDLDNNKIELLNTHLSEIELPGLVSCDLKNLPFDQLFRFALPGLKARGSGNFLFIDQFGIKEITKPIFRDLTSLRGTDTLFFVSSSYFLRFAQQKEFKGLELMDESEIHLITPSQVHRHIVDAYRRWIPDDTKYYLGQFSIKKGSNFYGLVFGSRNLKGLEVFLKAAWKMDPNTGQANHDMDQDEINEGQLTLEGNEQKPKKLDSFEKELRELLLTRKIETAQELYKFTLVSGCLPSHGKQVFSLLVSEGRIPKKTFRLGYNIMNEDPISLFKEEN